MALLSANPQTPKELLGVPFGSPISIARCPTNTAKALRPCWIGRPFIYKPTGSLYGHVYLPNSNQRPAWAANATFELTIGKSGVVQQLRVNTFNLLDRFNIAESISRRFGEPQVDELRHSETSWANWRSPEGYVEMRCQRERWIDFRTPPAQASLEAELASRSKGDAARPKSP